MWTAPLQTHAKKKTETLTLKNRRQLHAATLSETYTQLPTLREMEEQTMKRLPTGGMEESETKTTHAESETHKCTRPGVTVVVCLLVLMRTCGDHAAIHTCFQCSVINSVYVSGLCCTVLVCVGFIGAWFVACDVMSWAFVELRTTQDVQSKWDSVVWRMSGSGRRFRHERRPEKDKSCG